MTAILDLDKERRDRRLGALLLDRMMAFSGRPANEETIRELIEVCAKGMRVGRAREHSARRVPWTRRGMATVDSD